MFNRIFSYLALYLTLVLVPGTAISAELTATGEVRLESSSEPTAMFGLDLRAVEFSSDGKSLSFAVEVDRDISAYLEENYAQAVALFMFDTDNDSTSGGEVFGSTESGFEYTTTVYACKEFDGGRVCAGDIDGANTYVGEFETEAWDPAKGMYTPVHDFSWMGGDAVIDGSRIRAAIPYEDIGGGPGKAIRISIAAGSGRPVDVPSVVLTLK
jgi:hypothetical protein